MAQSNVIHKCYQTGFNLTELLIVCIVASLLLLGVSQFFISQHHTFLWQQGISRLQENGRFASFLLLRGIEEAGFQGCIDFKRYTTWLNNRQSMPGFDGIKGYHAVNQHWEPALPAELPKTVLPGSDLIEINRADEVGFQLLRAREGSHFITIEANAPPEPDQRILISNCEHYESHTIKRVIHLTADQYQLQLQSNLENSYPEIAFVALLYHTFYFIADTKRTNEQGYPIYALYTLNEHGQSTELVDGISGMRIHYRLLTPLLVNPLSPKPLTAKRVNRLKQWDHVASVEVDLLVDSVEAVPHHSGIYSFHDQTINEKNGRFYRLWHLVITLKTRCPLCNVALS